ncbi:hypothetical protein BSR29_01495 [Boudabousia liubingyangii]|uniref:HXXEE domain-containing protein n=1 Tax=Boudabousia liubingyangii TaxID=1921764 RepID=A0A1Q5PQ40_9ACTO|nr:HXXEE domain-containing protein [Boudabousia liubingyangii]OKL49657.1 hypothetical protein BSR29_01495 [Boudabousia liubingyangii]
MESVSFWLALFGFLLMFGIHEFEEATRVLPWLERNRDRLPAPFRHLRLSAKQFWFIAAEEALLIILVALLLDPVWLAGAVIAYAVHLLVHVVQILVTARWGFTIPVWTAVIELPVMLNLLFLLPTRQGDTTLLFTSLVMTGVMVVNLLVMHFLVRVSAQAKN